MTGVTSMGKADESVHDRLDQLKQDIEADIENIYSRKAREYAETPIHMGRMTDPDGAAMVRGACGDTMEIYLHIVDQTVSEVLFHTSGCGVTQACGSALAKLVRGRNINDILKFSPQDIIDELDGLPDSGVHCAILSVNTLLKALADYYLKMY
jgi:nitrogen fixation NifU-like protein